MTTVSVSIRDIGQLPRILGRVAGELAEGRRLLLDFEAQELRDIQFEHALSGWGGRPLFRSGRPLSASSVSDRQGRRGYYRNRPDPRASMTSVLFWTGQIASSTAEYTEVRESSAEVDTSQSYNGPIRSTRDPASEIAELRHGAVLWDEDRLDVGLDAATERHAERAAGSAAGVSL
jgi:hypothetical protein